MKISKNIKKLSLLLGITSFLIMGLEDANAHIWKGPGGVAPKAKKPVMKVAAGCDPPSSQIDLDINNVRARLMNGGDMWWDVFATGNARYEVPKVEPGGRSVHASFASGLWFGGLDEGGQLKTAGQTYRQTGLDFWAGPLDTVTAETTLEDCNQWDEHYSVTRDQINNALNGSIDQAVLNWPGNGNTARGQAQFMAPFFDANGDGFYNAADGDYPTLDPAELGAKPDQMIWWVYNDKGGPHTAYPGGEAIGLEIHALAFAFKSAAEINSMTFYKYKIFNRSSTPLVDTYFGVFTDSDLGNPADDYVGCNMAFVDSDGPTGPLQPKRRSFGYTYNGDPNDEDGVSLGYGAGPPVFGIDYFRGPKDENGNELPMTTFMFFTNAAVSGQNADPNNATELYKYLRGLWADGRILAYGTQNGRADPGQGDQCFYAFPGNTDPDGRPNWVETATPADRRMVQSSGPFVLASGAVNEVIIGAVWARAQNASDNLASIPTAIIADDKAQILFDNQFKLANGPDPVQLTAVPDNKKITLMISNHEKTEMYDVNELDDQDLIVYRYKFEGYRIFQLKDNTVDASQLTDPSKAIEIFQVDVRDSVKKIVNKEYDGAVEYPNAYVAVEGDDLGIKRYFEVTTDAFTSSSDPSLVNGKTYYFLCVPYAYSRDAEFTKYLGSRTATTVVSTTPNRQVINGLINGNYQQYLPVTKFDGGGNGGIFLNITKESEEAILATNGSAPVRYELGFGPVEVKVVDPAKIKNNKRNYRLEFAADYKSYKLYDDDTNEELMSSDTSYNKGAGLVEAEQLAEKREYENLPGGGKRLVSRESLGFYIKAQNNFPNIGSLDAQVYYNNNFIGAQVVYDDPSKAWLSAIPGNISNASPSVGSWLQPEDRSTDSFAVYTNILGGTWAPYRFMRANTNDNMSRAIPILDAASKTPSNTPFDSIGSYDIVFTSDTSKWSECVVIETGIASVTFPEPATIGNQKRFNVRKSDIGLGIGKGKFPGYAINVETGQRVNIIFGEASSYPEENGADMLWNPTSNRDFFKRGGRHFLYITRTKYDKGQKIWNTLTVNGTNIDNPPTINRRNVSRLVDWVTVPVVANGQDFLSTNARVKLRVIKKYRSEITTNSSNGVPYYKFNTLNILQNASNDDAKNKQAALDLINVVPNPYYAFSAYEQDRNDNRVRFTNLPAEAQITIYTTSGLLVRKLSKSDEATPFIEWDMRNSNRIPIATGVYIIHVNCPGIGERSLKWMAVMRPVDFTNF